jgi:hypothetical protein
VLVALGMPVCGLGVHMMGTRVRRCVRTRLEQMHSGKDAASASHEAWCCPCTCLLCTCTTTTPCVRAQVPPRLQSDQFVLMLVLVLWMAGGYMKCVATCAASGWCSAAEIAVCFLPATYSACLSSAPLPLLLSPLAPNSTMSYIVAPALVPPRCVATASALMALTYQVCAF